METKDLHRLLRRQLRKHLPENKELPEDFIRAVDQAYKDFDKDVRHTENILELSSQELFKVNQELKSNVSSISAEAEALSKQLSHIVNNIQEVVFQTDINGCWTFLNQAWERITGYKVEESIGQSFTSMVFPEDKELSMHHLSELVNGNETTSRYNLRYITKSGQIRWTEAIVSLDLDEEGRLLGASGTLTDIHGRYLAEEQLRLASNNLNQAQELTKLGSWEYSLESNHEVYWSPQMYKLLRLPEEKAPRFKKLRNLLKPESEEKLLEVLNQLTQHGGEISLEIELKDERWMNLRASLKEDLHHEKKVLTGTLLDITERKNFERDLIQAKQTAERALAIKSDFLSNMSHEIRTPMNAILGLTEILLKRKDLSDSTRSNLELIQYSADNLLVIINDILDFSKIEAKKLKLEKINFNLHAVIDKLLHTWRLKAEHKNIALESEWDEKLPINVIGDPYRLNQILLNLISNAMKFTQEGYVKLKVQLLEQKGEMHQIEFIVQDTGIGISAEKLHQIFESFTQAYTDTTRNFGGTGLGLAITKSLVEMHGGKLSVESKVGAGSTFKFQIEYRLAKSAPKSSLLKATLENSKDLEGLRTLVVEDNKVNQMLIKQVLKSWGTEISLAENGQAAVEICNTQNFDVIFMDLQMPIKNGFVATHEIRSNRDCPNSGTPILALTADAMPETRRMVEQGGFNSYITKPFKRDELFEEVLKVLNEPS